MSKTRELLVQEGLDLFNKNDWQRALNCFLDALKIEEDYPVLFAVSTIYFRLKDFENSIKYATRGLLFSKSNVNLKLIRAKSFLELGQVQQTIDLMLELVESGFESDDAHTTLGSAYVRIHCFKLAEKHFELALKHSTSKPAAMLNLALLYFDERAANDLKMTYQTSLAKSVQYLNLALKIEPVFHRASYLLGLIQLKLKNYVDGFKSYQARYWQSNDSIILRYKNKPILEKIEQAKNACVYVYAEQGLGDSIQFARFLPEFAKHCKRLIVSLQPPVQEFICRSIKNIEWISDANVSGNFDFQLPLIGIVELLAVNYSDVASHALRLDVNANESICFDSSDRIKIGIAWRGNPDHQLDHERSISCLEFIESLPTGPLYYVLHVDLKPDEFKILDSSPHEFIVQDSLTNHSLAELSVRLKACDFVLTVDTLIAHLAGTLNVPTRILLGLNSDWRWSLNEATTPWYSSVQLYRRRVGQSWKEVIAKAVI